MTVDNTRNPQIWQAVCWHTRTSGDSSVMIEVKSLSIVEQSWDVFCLTKISFFFFRNSKRLISEEHQVGSLCFSSCWLPTQSEELVSDNQLLRAQGLKPSLSFFLLFLLLLFVYLGCLGFVVIVVRFFAFSPNKESRQFIMKKRKKIITECTLNAGQGREIKMYIILSKEITCLKYEEDISCCKSGKERMWNFQYSLKGPILKKYFFIIFSGVS